MALSLHFAQNDNALEVLVVPELFQKKQILSQTCHFRWKYTQI